ncbi:DNA starvation/stationary phase protection protein [Sporolactobacillus sp. CPB3-1]|uniref:DNA starvation/stationary phase protection protein n=1 Tax=Sporolactobacillus mangiferae TaxID=2940498 RepID=A0ABT0MDZ5_9BACL|nr:DNA starvation/stationary phase protection protein [Sporolactobacillus mangiferae]MCL1632818.1 DNA starvation/stationary phase protection protein [Sporolactobacillus mangiferae]
MAITQAKTTKTFLNQQVANYGLFYTKLHQFHWYVKGHNFFTLHVKFEELYDQTTLILDDIAERLLQIGGEPYATLQEFLEHASLKEKPYTNPLTENEMVQAVIDDLVILRDELNEGIKLTDQEGDSVTNDMLIATKNKLDKEIWFYSSFLGKDPVPQKN